MRLGKRGNGRIDMGSDAMKKHIVIFCVLAVLILAATFPLGLKMGSCIPGFFSTDEPYAALWNFWWLKFAFSNGLPENSFVSICSPWGVSNYRSGYPVWNFINRWLSILTNNVVAYNLQILLSFILAGFFMYLLVYYLTRSRNASFLAALAYAFCPYHFVRSWQHLGLAQTQWMPLYVLTLFYLYKKPNIRNSLCSAAAFFLVMTFDLYYAFFMFIVTILFIFFLIAFQRKKYQPSFVRYILLAGLATFILVLPNIANIYVFIKATYAGNYFQGVYGYVRPFEDLFSQSAKALSYFLPAASHPFFGKFTEGFVGSSLYGKSFTEHTLYLGWMPLVLAFVAFRRLRIKRKLSHNPLGSNEGSDIIFFLLLASLAWLFSQPPWWEIGQLKIYMPSFFMYKIAPMFRAYCRFGVVVMLAVAVLAGFGLKFILERFRSNKSRLAVTVLCSSLVLFEFWNYPPFRMIDVSKVPQVYYWLKAQAADFAIAEYPLDIEGANVMYMYYQTMHEKKIINGTIPGTYANKVAKTITKLSEPQTAAILRWMGAKYILVHRDDYLNTELIQSKEELDMIPGNSGLKFIRTFPGQECPQTDIICVQKTGPIDVYEVVAEPLKPKE